MKTSKLLIILSLLLHTTGSAFSVPATKQHRTSNFVNPMLWADVPDPDVIRVGKQFYMVSTTMHLMPGAPIMRSSDLVNWETVSYIFDRLTDSPKYSMQGGTVYGRGQWATSLKYHKGRFYALFAPNDNPGGDTYIYSATRAEGPWTLVSRLPHFHDASLFFDDDNRTYVVYGTGDMVELSSDLKRVLPGTQRKLFQRDAGETGLLEGSRLVKHKGKYYLLMISWPNGKPRRQVCYRANSLTGSWEKRTIVETEFGGFSYIGQGTIVDAPDGRWYGVIFQDRGGVGRILTLLPCTWKDGWPMLGDDQGHVPQRMELPIQGSPLKRIVQNDEFESSRLKLCWQWNHNPVAEGWSLTARKGFLRLIPQSTAPNIFLARNTLTQRMEGPQCMGTVALDVSGMNDGDRCGLAAFNGDAGVLSVCRDNGQYTLKMFEQSVHLTNKEKAVTQVDSALYQTVPLATTHVFLRVSANFAPGQDFATFYYSTDNKTWHPIGSSFKMRFDYKRFFMGTRFAIFNYSTRQTGGHVDIDWFRYRKTSVER